MNFSDLRYLSFEVADDCEMADSHPFCPVNDPLRYPPHERREKCPDRTIVDFAARVHERGFAGMVGFHYYCDPLSDVDRMLSLMNRMLAAIPDVKFILWSNGALLQPFHRNWLEAFDKVVFTLHDPYIEPRLKEITGGLPNVEIARAYYDMRMDVYDPGPVSRGMCIRPSKIELPVNYGGNVRLCCADYRGTVSLGNIEEEDHGKILDGFAEAADIVATSRLPLCWRCRAISPSPAADV